MWGAISRLFNKQNGKIKISDDLNGPVMEKPEHRRSRDKEVETYESRLAKQRATLKWMLLKAFNRVPENLREPFYKDHEGQEHVKPQVVQLLATGELYCMALTNIYSDPNYTSLNHSGLLQALARKGVTLSDPLVTETTLIQTTPIKLSVHQVVMQGVMSVYTREVATPELVGQAVHRFVPTSPTPPCPHDHETALLLWINKAVDALKLRAQHLHDNEQIKKWSELHDAVELQDLCDGASLAALLSFYCPEAVPWSDIVVSQLPTVSDCVTNLSLVRDFCQDYLPSQIFLMQPEEVYYMRASLKQNLVVFLADLFNLLEINPARCVTLKNPTSHTNGSPILAPGSLKKPSSNHYNNEQLHENKNGGDSDFVVHRGRVVPTLSSVLGHDTEAAPAGKPTNWGDHRKQSFAGRRSRRNSLSEESQLTLENLCGSQENLHLLGRNPDKAPAVHSVGVRRDSVRSSLQDNTSPALHSALNHGGTVVPEAPPRRSLSRNNSFIESQRRAEESRSSAGVQQSLLQPSPPPSPQPSPPPESREKEKKITTFAALPNNTTTWQSISNQTAEQPSDNGVSETNDGSVMGSQLINIRMKLEEKRRRIENEKKRMEAQFNRQRQKLGKEAFLQAISKSKAVKSPDSDPGKESESTQQDAKPPRPFSLQDISEVEQKWLKGDVFVEERKTPDIENMDIESYQKSIAQMDTSLHEIQADLQRLAFEQNQVVSAPGGGHGGMAGLPPAPPAHLHSFASLHQAPTYNNIHYVNNTPPHHQMEYNNSPMQQPIYNNQPHRGELMYNNSPRQVEGYNRDGYGARVEGFGRDGYYGAPPSPYYRQEYRGTRYDEPPRPPHGYPPSAPERSNQWHSPSPAHQPSSHYENFSPRYSEGGYGGQSSYGSESGYGGSSGRGVEDSPVRPPKGEFYLHEPGRPARATWAPPDAAWSPAGSQRREPVSLSSSPQSGGMHMDNGDGGYRTSPPSLAPTPPPRTHAPVQPPPADDMEPQSISFIGSGEEEVPGLSKLQITSGNRTYRVSSPTKGYVPITSPSRPSQDTREQGFYISFDDDSPAQSQPRRPKPPLRTKRTSPKKERGLTQTLETSSVDRLVNPAGEVVVPTRDTGRLESSPRLPPIVHHHPAAHPEPPSDHPQGLIIGQQPDSVTLDEMERKKERIVLLSLQRRQAAEDARLRKDAEAARRRDEDKARQEERLRKKEDDKRRRAVILEQHKIKKAIEEAEREGKPVDKELLASLKAAGVGGGSSGGSGGPKLRGRTTPARPRPRTVHMDSDIVDASPVLTSSRGKKGSSSNLSVIGRPMRRDYYRGSQDCLAETRRTNSFSTEAGDESRGASPGRSLARRSSYKTPSRDPSPDLRSLRRPRYSPHYPSHRKSASLMNLAGGSSVGEGDCDSRSTRAPSPSGPGSLPLRPRRPPQSRDHYDDAASEAGSDYSGPRLYRQPTTKSNKGIIVNALEYCVFPGAVNKEAKRRVLDEVNRAEAKHFLVLFRDAGCQFRALYTYYPDTEEVYKLYGTGPKHVTDRMFDKFFKYNSGGKCFSQVHTKHLTVTIDAFTIHNSLWQGKKVNLPNKADMTLVI